MSYLSSYRSKLQASGNSASESIVLQSKQTINNNFDKPLFFQKVLVNGVQMDSIITQGKSSSDKTMLLKADTKINIGSIVKVKDETFLAVDFQGDGINEIYPTAKLTRCNTSLLLSGNEECVVVGQNDFGEDIVHCTTTEQITLPCIVERTVTTDNSEQAINLPVGRANITIPFTEHKDIAIGQSVNIYGDDYEIRDIDYSKSIDKTGLLILIGNKRDKE